MWSFLQNACLWRLRQVSPALVEAEVWSLLALLEAVGRWESQEGTVHQFHSGCWLSLYLRLKKKVQNGKKSKVPGKFSCTLSCDIYRLSGHYVLSLTGDCCYNKEAFWGKHLARCLITYSTSFIFILSEIHSWDLLSPIYPSYSWLFSKHLFCCYMADFLSYLIGYTRRQNLANVSL